MQSCAERTCSGCASSSSTSRQAALCLASTAISTPTALRTSSHFDQAGCSLELCSSLATGAIEQKRAVCFCSGRGMHQIGPQFSEAITAFFYGVPFTSKLVEEALQHRTEQWLDSFPPEFSSYARARGFAATGPTTDSELRLRMKHDRQCHAPARRSPLSVLSRSSSPRAPSPLVRGAPRARLSPFASKPPRWS